MTDTPDKEIEKSFMAAAEDAGHSDVDQELMALAPPPPSLGQAIFIGIIICFSIAILVLFWPELSYFTKVFSSPAKLGEAADVDLESLQSETYVEAEGVPLINKTVTFSTGKKWFSADIYRKMAPLSGNPNLLVQWSTPNPEIKQSKSTLSPPSQFRGRLKAKEVLPQNYEKFWPFYECMQVHPTSVCSHCIGKKDLADCRPVYTCTENYPLEVCDYIAFYSQEDVQNLLTKAQHKLDSGNLDAAHEHALLQRATQAFADISILTDLMRLEEAFSLLGNQPGDNTAAALRAKIFNALLNTDEIRLKNAIDKIDALDKSTLQRLKSSTSSLVRLRKDIEMLTEKKQRILPLYQIDSQLESFETTVKELIVDLAARQEPWSDDIAKFSLDAQADGAVVFAAMADLEALVAAHPKGKTDAHNSAPDAATPDHPELAALLPQLKQLQTRIQHLCDKMDTVEPGDLPKLEEWAGREDVITSLPGTLKTEFVLKNLKKIEVALSKLGTKENIRKIDFRYSDIRKALKKAKSDKQQIHVTSGLEEYELVSDFRRIQSMMKPNAAATGLDAAAQQRRLFKSVFAMKDFYPADLSNYPNIKKALEKELSRINPDKLYSDAQTLAKTSAPPIFLLQDGEVPGDNLWILFIFIAVPIMLVLNIRKLYYFIAAWRA